MMKAKKFIVLVMFLILSFPVVTYAANETLGDYKRELKDLQAKKAAQDSEKQKTQNEINSTKKKISNAEYELNQTKKNIENVKKEIEETNQKIDNTKEHSEAILRLYQELRSENVYMSYVTGASSMTELIMRMDAINEINDYNEAQIMQMEQLSNDNKKLTKELEKYQVTLNEKIKEYEAAVVSLNEEMSKIDEGVFSLKEEIDVIQNQIKEFEMMGCKDDEPLSACLNVVNNSGWLKPISKGRITSLFGNRTAPTAGASSNHKGIDISTAEGTKVYATATGTVGAISLRKSCGGNMVYIWTTVNGKKYTYVFMHMLEIWVKVGDKVTVNTVVGLSGGGSTAKKNGGYDTCTTGAHLHYGLAEGGWYGYPGGPSLGKFNSNTINPPGYPGLYQWFYSR